MTDAADKTPAILFVDDEEHVLRSMRRLLMHDPFTVLTAGSAAEALDILADREVDAVVSDEKMPGVQGSELLAEINRLHPEICRIMLTGEASLDSAMLAINQGRIFRFLLKPVSREDLLAALHQGLSERRQSDRLLALSQQAGNVCSLELRVSSGGKTIRTRWSENARSLLAFDPDASLDSLEPFFARLHPEDAPAVHAAFSDFGRQQSLPLAEYRILLPGGKVRWIAQSSDVVQDAGRKTVRLLSVLKDVTERRKQEDRLRRQAFHDSLTGLGNRAMLLRDMDAVLSRSAGTAEDVALLFLDLDDFKLVNDSMGHAFGDRLLQAFAERLASVLPPEATAARLGGDEFAILLEGGREAALALADKALGVLAAPFRIQGYEFAVSASLGLAFNQTPGVSGLDLLRDADTAMYAAKSAGKKGFRLFDSGMRDRASERFRLISEMRKGLERDDFFLLYQPIVRLDDLATAGFEALLRWQSPDLGLVMPVVFIPLAEESGLIVPLGRRVMKLACAQASLWSKAWAGAPPFVSFNVAVQQLRQAGFMENLDRVVRTSGLDPGRLKAEITESGLMDDVEFSLRVLSGMKGLGLRLQIDDFGTGYSSLSYLQRIPADSMKVDQSFVNGMESDREKYAIVKTIVALAHTLGMSVVAEGVETRAQLSLLRELRCEFGQGYLFDKPLPPEQAIRRETYSHLLEPEA